MYRALLILACLLITFASGHSGYCQGSGNVSSSGSNTENRQSTKGNTGESQAQSGSGASSDAATDGTARVKNLANLEALLNIIANGCEILGFAIGGPLCLAVPVGLVMVFFKGKRLIAVFMILTGPVIVISGLAVPGLINLLVGAARDANLFS